MRYPEAQWLGTATREAPTPEAHTGLSSTPPKRRGSPPLTADGQLLLSPTTPSSGLLPAHRTQRGSSSVAERGGSSPDQPRSAIQIEIIC